MFDNGNHVVLRRDGVAVVLKTPQNEMPQVEYWGRDFGVPSAEGELSALDAMTLKVTPPAEKPDAALRPSLLPQGAEAFAGRSGLEAYRGTAPVFVRWTTVETQVAHSGHELLVHAKDAVNLVELDVRLSLAEGGLVLMDERITNIDMEHEEPLTVNWLDSVLPIPRRADHLTQFTGRWPLEKQPQTGPLPRGSVTRDCRHGKTSHESPWLFIASDGEPLFDSGEVWACHLAWSGNQTYRLDNLPQHEPLLGAGELLGPGEIQLLPGSDYATPQVCFSWSDHGLDGMAARFHRWLRSLPNHVRGDRLVTLNTWEAVYFDHDEATLIALADLAAKVGVERFVLDDGWFHLRRDDTKGLGDWIVDPEVWPNGLDALAEHVHAWACSSACGSSRRWSTSTPIARASTQTGSSPRPRPCRAARTSHTARSMCSIWPTPDAYRHVRGQMADLIRELGIDYIKWDHNRDVTEPVHDGHCGLHAQTEAAYRLSSRGSRSKAVLRAVAAPTQGSCSTPTASGRPIRTTRATAWTSSAPPSSWCRPR